MSKPITLNIDSKSVAVGAQNVQVLGQISHTIEAGSFVSIIGPSGCGKSTLLRAIMGLDLDFIGNILIGESPVLGPGTDRGIVFQEARLLPWSRLRQNIAFALPPQAEPRAANARIERLIELFGLKEFSNAWPNQLSGGMLQRAAIARALVNLPEVLLMDEPFGALDAHTKNVMQEELAAIFNSQRTTTVMVTHDVEEAIFLSDAIMILSGRPGSLLDVIKVEIPRPRSRVAEKFVSLRFEVVRRAFAA
jgi:sulfonate transport system ATP-binding protein